MKRHLFLLSLVPALMSAPALAADMYVKAAPPVPPPVYNWSGFYIDGGLGGKQDNFGWTLVNPAPATLAPNSMSESQLVGAVHAGIQLQWRFLVLGMEVGGMSGLTSNNVALTTSTGTPTSVCSANLGQTCQMR